MSLRCGALAGCALAAATLLPAAASKAAVTIGSNLTDPANENLGAYCSSGGPCTGTNLSLPAASTAADGVTSPIDGVVVRWRVKSASAGNAVALRVLRPVGGAAFTGAGTSLPGATIVGAAEFGSQLPIRAGDSIGLNISSSATVWGDISAANAVLWGALNGFPIGLADGASATGAAVANRELLVQAAVEPDCDGDALGDETQDPAVDCTPPDTTITATPKEVVKTKKKSVKISFEFSSSEPNPSFQCQLDGGAFQPCSSPFDTTVTARKKKPADHSFAVRAVDAAGNADPTPASYDFKAKRKKKK